MSCVHLLHSRLVDSRTFIDTSLGMVFLVFFFELLLENLLLIVNNFCLFLLILLETHHQSLKCLLVGLLDDKIFDGGVGLFALHKLIRSTNYKYQIQSCIKGNDFRLSILNHGIYF
jgi:hypothetical protein